jgi:hypothetical protein
LNFFITKISYVLAVCLYDKTLTEVMEKRLIWPHDFGPIVRQSIMVKMPSLKKRCSPHGDRRQREGPRTKNMFLKGIFEVVI